jgi:hypothetical protein
LKAVDAAVFGSSVSIELDITRMILILIGVRKCRGSSSRIARRSESNSLISSYSRLQNRLPSCTLQEFSAHGLPAALGFCLCRTWASFQRPTFRLRPSLDLSQLCDLQYCIFYGCTATERQGCGWSGSTPSLLAQPIVT